MFISNLFRLIFIVYVVNKNGGLFLLQNQMPKLLFFMFRPLMVRKRNKSKGEIIRNILHKLGPIFIKFGQVLATRSDLVGDDIAMELSYLQDRLPPVKKSYVKETIKNNFGKNAEEIFSEFDYQAVAAASIAEVFKAKNKQGEQVAVKVLKPDIKKEFARDIKFFRWATGIIEKLFTGVGRLRLVEVINTFEELIKVELDLKLEAAAASKLQSMHKDDGEIYIPRVYWELTTANILTLEWVEGIKINEIEQLQQNKLNLNKVSAKIVLMFLNQALTHGFFHADLHPGNIFINKKGQIVLLDFGIMGHLDRKSKIYITEILYGFIKRDYEYVAKVHFEAGYVPKNKSFASFAQACRAIGEPIIDQPVNKVSVAKLLNQLFKTTKDFDMETQPQLLLLQKTMVMVEGLGAKLNPGINMWEVSRPFIEEWAKLSLAFDAKIINKLYDISEKLELIFNNFKNKETAQQAQSPSTSIVLYFLNVVLVITIIYLISR